MKTPNTIRTFLKLWILFVIVTAITLAVSFQPALAAIAWSG